MKTLGAPWERTRPRVLGFRKGLLTEVQHAGTRALPGIFRGVIHVALRRPETMTTTGSARAPSSCRGEFYERYQHEAALVVGK